METKILVTGASGNVGTHVVKALQAKGMPFRIGARNADIAQETFGNEVEVVHFDFLDPATYSQTFAGIERMFLVRPPRLSNVTQEIAPAVHAAIAADMKHMVFLSIQGVEKNRVVNYTFLRAGFFMQNLSTTHRREIVERSEIALPVGNARTSFIDTRDIGAVAVRALTEAGHENRAYTLTGAEALDYHEVADIMSDVLQWRIRYSNPSVISFFRQQLAKGSDIGYALVVSGLYTITRFGNAAEVTDDVQQILGRAPISFRQFVKDHRDVWLS